MTSDAVCDFCSTPNPAWEYPVSRDIVTTAPISGRSIDYGNEAWAACDTCSTMIEEDRWGDLTERLLKIGPRLNLPGHDPRHAIAEKALREQKAELHALLALHRGPRQPITP